MRAHPLLSSPVRAKIVRLVEEHPGIGMGALAHRLGLDWSSVGYHVERLEAAGLVTTAFAGRRRLLYPTRAAAPLDPDAQAALAEPTARRIALAILDAPGTSAVDLVRSLDETPRVVYHHVKRLVELGLVRAPSPGSRRGLVAEPRLAVLRLDGWVSMRTEKEEREGPGEAERLGPMDPPC